MNEIQWVPEFIRLTQHNGLRYRLQIAQIAEYEPKSLGELNGCDITLVGTTEVRFVRETPEQIDELIRQAWEGGVSLRAEIQMAVESGEAE